VVSDNLIAAINSQSRVAGLTHDFYRYPARFSPILAREIITQFSKPGDLVIDPFVGGGTTLVECASLGRKSIGIDLSSLATFIGRVKTTPLQEGDGEIIRRAVSRILSKDLLSSTGPKLDDHYGKNLGSQETWRIRKFLAGATGIAKRLHEKRCEEFVRMILLRAGQWALDSKRELPSISALRSKVEECAELMLQAIDEFAFCLSLHDNDNCKPIILERSAVGLDEDPIFELHKNPALILTSPPYPGLHMLYHRWQIEGRRETAFPFWLAGSLDGRGASYYNLGGRHEPQLLSYYNNLSASLSSLRKLCTTSTTLVQVVAFSEPEWQLEEYLRVVKKIGFEEFFPRTKRIVREVPSRKWYTSLQAPLASKFEYVLFHKLI